MNDFPENRISFLNPEVGIRPQLLIRFGIFPFDDSDRDRHLQVRVDPELQKTRWRWIYCKNFDSSVKNTKKPRSASKLCPTQFIVAEYPTFFSWSIVNAHPSCVAVRSQRRKSLWASWCSVSETLRRQASRPPSLPRKAMTLQWESVSEATSFFSCRSL